jgi:hypothetical protein
MKAHYHAGISLVLAIALFAAFRSMALSVSAMLSGIFIDIDHGFDYLREYGFRFDLKFFFHSFHHTLYKRVILLFHGWEWAILLVISSIASQNPIVSGLTIGIVSHLICDQLTNGVSKWGYFIFFRLRRDFIVSRIFPGKGIQ